MNVKLLQKEDCAGRDIAAIKLDSRKVSDRLNLSPGEGKKSGFWLDPRSKMLTLLVVNIIVFQLDSQTAAIAAFALVCLLIATIVPLTDLLKYACGVPILALSFWGLNWIVPNPIIGLAAMVGIWLSRFTISLGIAYYVIKSTQVSEFTAALHLLHISKTIAIPFAVMLRFIPTVVTEMKAITEAMRLRRISTSVRSIIVHPAQTTEFLVVPLLASITRIGDDLAASAMLRGLARTNPPSSITTLKFSWRDALVLLTCVGLVSMRYSGWELV